MILVTGGAGFIGSRFVNLLIEKGHDVVVLDKLTYAGDLSNLTRVVPVIVGDIGNGELVRHTLRNNKISTVFNFAAETHVDKSIHDSRIFTKSNVLGTHVLVDECHRYWGNSSEAYFHQVSTDEVYGSLTPTDAPSRETDRYDPKSPYAASKAGADHIVRSYMHTHLFPAIITNCTNNYGERQSLEKLIPLMIYLTKNDLPLPVYGDGKQVRDWLHVQDHCEAIYSARESGALGETYNISGGNQRENIDVVRMICGAFGKDENELVRYVEDRKGHDRRYDLDSSKLQEETGWKPKVDFQQGIFDTVDWYLNNYDWVERHIERTNFSNWMKKNYKFGDE